MTAGEPPVIRRRFVAYIRVSTVDQAERGVSLADQRARLAAYAVALDVDLIGTYEDAGVSAKSLSRPGLREALAVLDQGGADGLMITKLDRLTRSVRDLGELLDGYFSTKYALVSLGDSLDTRTAAGRMVLNILTSVGQWEREAGGERTTAALRHLKSVGVVLGRHAPYGRRRTSRRDVEGRLVVEVDPDAVAARERAGKLRAEGLSLREIARRLIAEGFTGRRWCPSTVSAVLMAAS